MLLGMTGMVGSAGLLKGYHRARAVSAPAVRVDDVVRSDICLFKADVEGYEPQVFQTAQELLSRHSAPALQLELSKGHTRKGAGMSSPVNAQVCISLLRRSPFNTQPAVVSHGPLVALPCVSSLCMLPTD